MKESLDQKSFGERIRAKRTSKEWTVKDFIQRLESKGQKSVSPAYITRIEQYGEIPSPELICVIADVLEDDAEQLLECAKKIKVKRFNKNLEAKYQKAVGLHRIQKRNKGKME